MVISILSLFTLGKSFSRTLAFAFSILANFCFKLIHFLLFCFHFRALLVDGLWTNPWMCSWAINAETSWSSTFKLVYRSWIKVIINRVPRRKSAAIFIKKALIHGYHFIFEHVYFRFQVNELIAKCFHKTATSLAFGTYEVVKYLAHAAGWSPFLKSSFCCIVPTLTLVS